MIAVAITRNQVCLAPEKSETNCLQGSIRHFVPVPRRLRTVISYAQRPVEGGILKKAMTHQINTLPLPADEGYPSSEAGVSAQQERQAVPCLSAIKASQ